MNNTQVEYYHFVMEPQHKEAHFCLRPHGARAYCRGMLWVGFNLFRMNGEHRLLITYEPIKFERYRLRFKISCKITDHSRIIYKIYPNLIKKIRKVSTCNKLDLEKH